jgi:hypothetical protein
MADEIQGSAPYTATLKAGAGFEAPWLVVRADSAGELVDNLLELDDEILDALVEAAGKLTAKYGFAPKKDRPERRSSGDNDSPPRRQGGQRQAGGRGFQGRGGGGGQRRSGGGGGGGGGNAASTKQIDLIKRLREEKDWEGAGVEFPANPRDLDKREASDLIEALMACDDDGVDAAWG